MQRRVFETLRSMVANLKAIDAVKIDLPPEDIYFAGQCFKFTRDIFRDREQLLFATCVIRRVVEPGRLLVSPSIDSVLRCFPSRSFPRKTYFVK